MYQQELNTSIKIVLCQTEFELRKNLLRKMDKTPLQKQFMQLLDLKSPAAKSLLFQIIREHPTHYFFLDTAASLLLVKDRLFKKQKKMNQIRRKKYLNKLKTNKK
jgi:hypothetical protein